MEKLEINSSCFLFDLDGTLIDSVQAIYDAVNATRLSFRLPISNFSFVFDKVGLGAEKLFEDLDVSNETIEEMVNVFRKFLLSQVFSHENVYPGVFKLLDLLKSYKCKTAVVTNKPNFLARKALQESELLDYFDVIVGADQLPKKPDPSILFRALEKLGESSNESFMVGDRAEDMRAAISAKVAGIGIAQGPHSEYKLYENGANSVFASIQDLYNYFAMSDKRA